MATLLERLALRIAAEDAEIQRIKTDAQANIRAAEGRKAILVAAQAKLFEEPELETLLVRLAQAGVKVVE